MNAPRLRQRRGLSIAEVLVSLAITAMLLTAISAAFSSSADVISANDRFFRATQSARVSLNLMLTEIRRCDSVQATSTQIDIIRPDNARPANEQMRSYKYDAANRQLVMFFTYLDGSRSVDYPLASEIDSATPFSQEMGTDANNTACVSRVSIALQVKVGSGELRISGSASPRRNITYK